MKLRAILLFLALLPAVSAGTSSNPEIKDGQGDVQGAAPEQVDVLAAWLHASGDTITAVIQVAAEFDASAPLALQYALHMEVNGTRSVAEASVGLSVEAGGAASSASIVADRLIMTIPADAIGITREDRIIEGLVVESSWGAGALEATDRAPDEGEGRGFRVDDSGGFWQGSDPGGTGSVGDNPGGTGQWIWRQGVEPLFATDDSVYGHDETVLALDATTGDLRWNSTVEVTWAMRALVVGDELLLQRHDEARDSWSIMALSTGDGSVLREVHLDRRPGAWTAAYGDLFMEVWGTDDAPSGIVRMSPESEIKWHTENVAQVDGAPLVLGNKVFVLSFQELSVLDAATGVRIGATPLTSGAARHTPITDGQRVFVHTGLSMMAVNATSGTVEWENDQGAGWPSRGPATRDGRVYLSSARDPSDDQTDSVTAFDATTGEVLWRWASPRPAMGIAGMVVTGAHVYVGTGANPYQCERADCLPALYALDAASGDMRWAIPTAETVWPTSAIDGRLFLLTELLREPWEEPDENPFKADGNLIALDIGAGGADRPSVMFVPPKDVIAGQPVLFVDTSTAADRPLSRWRWDVDGVFETSARNATVVFPTAGERTVRLAVFDDWGRSAAYSMNVTVLDSAGVKESPAPLLSVGLLLVAVAVLRRRS